MKQKTKSNAWLSAFCMELTLLLHAGIGVENGLHLLLEDGKDPVLARLAELVGEGHPLSQAMAETGVFPDEVRYLTETGEKTGRQEEALRALSAYYDDRDRWGFRIRNALLYPVILLVLMLVVIVILLAKVLPVFNQVFTQLGGQMTGLAGGLLQLGILLNSGLPVLCAILAAIAAAAVLFSASEPFRSRVLGLWNRNRGDRGLSRQLTTARFASALSMGMRSGLPLDEAFRLAASFHTENAALNQRFADAFKRLEAGDGLAEVLREAGIFRPIYCRMLALGVRSGTGDAVMEEIARRLARETEEQMEETLGRVEPTIVILSSLLVGAILLSVMLPLLQIMSAIG